VTLSAFGGRSTPPFDAMAQDHVLRKLTYAAPVAFATHT
jgi:hypothetical protein